MRQLLIDAMYKEARSWMFWPGDDPSDEDIEEAQETLFQFAKGLMVLLSDEMKRLVEYLYRIYSWEIGHFEPYDQIGGIPDDVPHLRKEASDGNQKLS